YLLRMFDANAHLKWFVHERHAAANEHLVRVPGAVTDGQHRDIGGDPAGRRENAANPAIDNFQIFDATGETNFAAQGFNAPADRFDDRGQAVTAEVRPVLVDNRWLAFALGEQLENSAHIGPGIAASQFAVA